MLEVLAIDPAHLLVASALGDLWASSKWYLLLLLGFSLVVFFHELGHFAMAKWADIRVERFAVGFGPELFGFTYGETRYSFNILPLGGYVRMLGQDDFDTDEEIMQSSDPRSYINKPVGHRMAVVSAGVIMNLILAAVLFMIVYMVGKVETKPLVGYLQAGSPAYIAGIQVGDEIKTINGSAINSFEQISMAVVLADPLQPLNVEIIRDGKTVTKKIVPKTSEMTRLLQIGIGPAQNTEISYLLPDYLEQGGPLPEPGDTIVEVNGEVIGPQQGQRMWDLLHQGGPAPVPFVVERRDPANPNAPPKRIDLVVKKDVTFLVNGPDPRTSPRDLLGLIPRNRVSEIEPQSAAARAGLLVDDVIIQFGNDRHPTRAEIWDTIKGHAGRDIPMRVRRGGEDLDLTLYYTPRTRLRYRGKLAVGLELEDTAGHAVIKTVEPNSLASNAKLQAGDVITRWHLTAHPTSEHILASLESHPEREVLVWVERDGELREGPLRYRGNVKVSGGLKLDAMEQDQLVVAGVVRNDEFFFRPSQAAATTITKGSRITAVNGQPVSHWGALAQRFFEQVGSEVEISYLDAAGNQRTAEITIPRNISSAARLPSFSPSAQAFNFLLDDKGEVEIKLLGVSHERSASHPMAIAHYLNDRIGQQVKVTFQNDAGEIVEKPITVQSDIVDPWYRRVSFSVPLRTGSVTYLNRHSNPMSAVWAGATQTYFSVASAYKTFQRMIFTRSVGVEKISGPVGIIKMGTDIAKVSFVGLLYFLAFLSANLAVINFLPLPIVDGGLMVFLIIEKIKGSPVSIRVQVATQMLGLALIGTTFLLVTFNDISKLFG